MATGWTPMVQEKCYIREGRYPGQIDQVDPNRKKPFHVKYKVTVSGFGQTLSGTNQGWFSRSELEKRTA